MNPIPRPERARRFGGCRIGRGGIAAIEFAIIAPLAALLMLATADLATFLRVRLQVDEAATGLANVVSQYTQLYAGDFTGLYTAAQQMAGTTSVTGTLGRTIITGIVNSGSGPLIAWQQVSPGSNSFASQFGKVGAVPTLPDGYALPSGDSLIATEIYAQATPWVLSAKLIGNSKSTVMHAYALFQPRSALLAQIAAGNRP